MKGTPEENIDQIHGTISGLIESMSVLNKVSDGNDQQIRANMLAVRQFAAGMADHDKKIKSLDKLINMMVDCGTSKDLEKQLGNLKQSVGAIRSYVRGLIDAISESGGHTTRKIVEKLSIVENDLIKVIKS